MDKTLIIVLDEFSERALEYSNVTMFDYGFLDEVTEFDYVSNGLGGIDDTQVTLRDETGGFYEVTPDNIDYSFQTDIDFLSESTVQTADNGEALARVYSVFTRTEQSPEDVPNHGDWVIETIAQTLTDPNKTDILAIDVDLDSQQFRQVFEVSTFELDGVEYTEPALIKAVFDYLETYDASFNQSAANTYLPAAFTASLGGQTVTQNELDTLEYFEFYEVPIFQASANEGQGGVDWGSVYDNVLNVGAWNAATNGELLLSSEESRPNVDLAGDGIVERQDWGTNFGTSFATPRIAAEFVNLANAEISELNANGGRLSDFFDTTLVPPSYSQLVSTAIPSLTSMLQLSYQDAGLSDAFLPVSTSSIAANGINPRVLQTASEGLQGTSLSSVIIASDSSTPTQGPNNLVGDVGADVIFALGGDDTVVGGPGDDQLDGGAGTDTARYSGVQNAYTLVLSRDSTMLTDRTADGNGTDTLSDFEFLDFNVDYFTGPFNLTQFAGTTGLSASDFETFIELYIAYFNRAPDAVGLNFWGSAFAQGTTLEEMATLFVGQEETQATYPEGTSNNEFATSVYNNVLGRTPDQGGIDFWVGLLDAERVSRDEFILRVLEGAKSGLKPEEGQDFVDQQLADRAYLENKVDIGAYYAVHRGLSDTANASAAMALFDGSQSSIGDAITAIDGYYSSALDPTDGEFILQVIGVLDNPFIA